MKAGIIFGLLALGLGASMTMISPVCLPPFALLLGLGAGYVGGFFDRPTDSRAALRAGAWAGLIAGVFMVIGQVLGTVGAATFLGPTRSALIMRSMGVPSFTPPGASFGFVGGLIGMLLIVGLVNVLVTGGAGAAGGAIWWQTAGRRATQAAEGGAASDPMSQP
ncbi:MAG: hypothetical protein U0822_09080 [Anaerolineae bacterium]